jgi:hypothetical protein
LALLRDTQFFDFFFFFLTIAPILVCGRGQDSPFEHFPLRLNMFVLHVYINRRLKIKHVCINRRLYESFACSERVVIYLESDHYYKNFKKREYYIYLIELQP